MFFTFSFGIIIGYQSILLIKLNPFLSGSINFLAGRIIFVWESLRRVYFTFYHLFITASCLPFLSIPIHLKANNNKKYSTGCPQKQLLTKFLGLCWETSFLGKRSKMREVVTKKSRTPSP